MKLIKIVIISLMILSACSQKTYTFNPDNESLTQALNRVLA